MFGKNKLAHFRKTSILFFKLNVLSYFQCDFYFRKKVLSRAFKVFSHKGNCRKHVHIVGPYYGMHWSVQGFVRLLPLVQSKWLYWSYKRSYLLFNLEPHCACLLHLRLWSGLYFVSFVFEIEVLKLTENNYFKKFQFNVYNLF